MFCLGYKWYIYNYQTLEIESEGWYEAQWPEEVGTQCLRNLEIYSGSVGFLCSCPRGDSTHGVVRSEPADAETPGWGGV